MVAGQPSSGSRREVRAELDSAVVPSVRGQPGASISVRPSVQPWELPSPAVSAKAVKHWSLRSVQVKLIKMGGRLVRHSRRLIFQLAEVSVPRRLFQGVLDPYRPVTPGQAEEGTTTILPRGESAPGVALSSMRFHPTGRGHEDDEDGQEGCSTTANASLIG